MNRLLVTLMVANAAALVAACGGGGSDSPAPAAPVATVSLSSANQDAVARAAANAVVGSANIAAVNPAAADTVKAAAATTPVGTVPRSLPQLLLNLTQDVVIDRLLARQSGTGSSLVRTQAVITATENCAVSGSVTATLDDRDNSGTASSGDVFTVTFSQCRPSDTELVDGSISASYTLVQQLPGSFSASATVTYSNLTATSAEGSFAVNGSFSYNLSRVGGVGTAQLAIGPNGLSATIAASNYTDTITLGAGYAITVTRDPAALPPGSAIPGLTTLTVNGAVTANSLGGTIVVSTPVAVKQYEIDPFPREGQIQVRGANNGLLVLTVLSTEAVRVQLDGNGDGTFEITKDVAWVDLI